MFLDRCRSVQNTGLLSAVKFLFTFAGIRTRRRRPGSGAGPKLRLRAENAPFFRSTLFHAPSVGLGGVSAPYAFGKLIESGSRQSVFGGYVFAAALMFAASFVAARFGVPAERKPLEQVATPLSAV
jgi:hypothetical protein